MSQIYINNKLERSAKDDRVFYSTCTVVSFYRTKQDMCANHPPLSLHCQKLLLREGRLLGFCAHFDGLSSVGYVGSQQLHWFQWSSITLLCPCTGVTFLQHSYKLGHKTCALLLYIAVELLHQQTCAKPLLHDLRETSFRNRVSGH